MTLWQIFMGIVLGIIGVGFAFFVMGIFVFMHGMTHDPLEHIDEE